jgi:hypothetical protein
MQATAPLEGVKNCACKRARAGESPAPPLQADELHLVGHAFACPVLIFSHVATLAAAALIGGARVSKRAQTRAWSQPVGDRFPAWTRHGDAQHQERHAKEPVRPPLVPPWLTLELTSTPISTSTVSYFGKRRGRYAILPHIQAVRMAAILHVARDAEVPSLRFPLHPRLLFQIDAGLCRQVVA